MGINPVLPVSRSPTGAGRIPAMAASAFPAGAVLLNPELGPPPFLQSCRTPSGHLGGAISVNRMSCKDGSTNQSQEDYRDRLDHFDAPCYTTATCNGRSRFQDDSGGSGKCSCSAGQAKNPPHSLPACRCGLRPDQCGEQTDRLGMNSMPPVWPRQAPGGSKTARFLQRRGRSTEIGHHPRGARP